MSCIRHIRAMKRAFRRHARWFSRGIYPFVAVSDLFTVTDALEIVSAGRHKSSHKLYDAAKETLNT